MSTDPEEPVFTPREETFMEHVDRAGDDVPLPAEMLALEDKRAAHYARLNMRLVELTREEARKYVALRNRVASLLFFLTHEPIPYMIERGTRLVSEALDDIDPYWKTHGLPPEDYQRYRAMDDEHMSRTMDRALELDQQEGQD